MADLNVVAILTAKAGSEKLLGKALSELVGPSLAEEGCISYQLFVAADPATFVTVETWKSQDDLDAHSRYIQQASKAFGEHLAQAPVIYSLSQVSIS